MADNGDGMRQIGEWTMGRGYRAGPGLRRLFPVLGLRGPSSVHGFTLAEIIVVLAVIALTMAVVVPRIGTNWKQIEDKDFLREFTETIKRSRLWAMNSNHPVAFRLNGVSRVYGFEKPPVRPIPLNVEVFSEHLQQDQESGDFLIIFHPDGSLVGNDVEVIFDHQRKYRVLINPLFGTVSLIRVE